MIKKYIHIYIYIYIMEVISVYKKYTCTISLRPMNPPTLMSTKMGIKYPMKKWSPNTIHTIINTHGPLDLPPSPLSAGGVPPAGGPLGPGGSRPIIVSPAIVA
jgi:hypothetical protein